jgi:hypothetical protein
MYITLMLCVCFAGGLQKHDPIEPSALHVDQQTLLLCACQKQHESDREGLVTSLLLLAYDSSQPKQHMVLHTACSEHSCLLQWHVF